MKTKYTLIALILFGNLSISSEVLAHAGHDKAPGEDADTGTGGPIIITAEAKKNLELTVEEAEIRTLEKTLTVIGQIEPIPNKSAAVSSRISGRVSAVYVTDGQTVNKGQALIQVESRQVGDPPPRVQYSAPINGVIVDVHTILGDTVEPDKHLMEVVDLSEIYAEGRIYEGQVPLVHIGQKARIIVESYPNETFSGTLEFMSGSLDLESRTLKVWLRVKNPDGKLRPNMRATLNLVTAEADSVVAVPHSAVLGEAGNYFIFVQSEANELVFERRSVVTGMKDDRYIEIIEGVYPSDKVVTLGNYQLQYVTTKAPPKKDASSATHAEQKAEGTSTLTWVGIAIVILLALNLLLLWQKSRQQTR